MKSVISIVLLFVSMSITVNAAETIQVGSVNVDTTYDLYDTLTGMFDLYLEDVPLQKLIRTNTEETILLKTFLDANAATYTCEPESCQSEYTRTSGSETLTVDVEPEEPTYVGFYLESEGPISLQSLFFNITSDFTTGTTAPLRIDFFGERTWTFNEFSEVYSNPLYGCYNPTTGTPGPELSQVEYCGMIPITETAAVRIGVDVDNGDTSLLKMRMYSEDGSTEYGGGNGCIYDPYTAPGCVIEADSGGVFEAGTYRFCVEESAQTNYRVYSETTGNTCGFVNTFGPGTGSRDYAIHVETARYADANTLTTELFNYNTLTSDLETYIEARYNGDCSAGCTIPLSISGVEQDITFTDVRVGYQDQNGAQTENITYKLSPQDVLTNFNGTLDVKYARFNVTQTGAYRWELGTTELFELPITINEPTRLTGITPLRVPAGVPVELRALTTKTTEPEIQYKWTLGTNSSTITTKPAITHIFPTIGPATVRIQLITSAGPGITETYTVNAINPEKAINESLNKKRASLNEIKQIIEQAPIWYRQALKNHVQLDTYETALATLEQKARTVTNGSALITLATDVYALELPTQLYYEVDPTHTLLDSESWIEPEAVARIEFTGSTANANAYTKTILNWQRTNIAATVIESTYTPLYDTRTEDTFRVYDVTVQSYLGEAGYLVLDKQSSELTFQGTPTIIDSGSHTLIPLTGNGRENIAFYTTGPTEVTFFTSPKLSTIPLEITVDCNNNNICEEELGENTSTCRADCKPVGKTITYLILLTLFALLLYGILQVWYKRRYETYLFTDRTQLYNLLMFISNAQARNTSDKEIIRALTTQGWSHERIIYAMKKARGERTGMLELLPIEKLMSIIRKRKAKKAVQKGNPPPQTPVSPPMIPRRQNRWGNINKPGGFGNFRR